MKRISLFTILLTSLFVLSCNTGKTWDQTKQENTVFALQEFLANNPETEHKDSVLLLICELDWLFAKTENTIVVFLLLQLKKLEQVKFMKK